MNGIKQENSSYKCNNEETMKGRLMDDTKNDKHVVDLLELASTFSATSNEEGSTTTRRRGSDGALPDWHKYAAMHPENMANNNDTSYQPPTVCHGRNEWKNATNRQQQNQGTDPTMTTVISWNILSDTWFRQNENSMYSHTEAQHGQWANGRLSNLLEWFQSLDADLVSLQEVDFDKFDQDLLPALQSMGYEGIIQQLPDSKKRMKDKRGSDSASFVHPGVQPCGVATFWKTSQWKIQEQKSFSRSMALILEQVVNHDEKQKSQMKILGLVNVHLEMSRCAQGAKKRARQLNSPMAWLAEQRRKKDYRFASTIICGDFNAGADEPLFDVLRQHKWHDQYGWALVYEHPVAYGSMPVNRGTFLVPQHHYLIDHLVYSHKRLRIRHILDPFTSQEIQEYLGNGVDQGFPSALCPSDHLPIGAMFELLPITDDEHKQELERERFVEQRLIQLRKEYQEEILSCKPNDCKKGKPTKEELDARREYKLKLKKWKLSFEENPTDFAIVTSLINKTAIGI